MTLTRLDSRSGGRDESRTSKATLKFRTRKLDVEKEKNGLKLFPLWQLFYGVLGSSNLSYDELTRYLQRLS